MNNTKTTQLREVSLEPMACNGCRGCIELNPDIFGWDDLSDRPFLITDKADEEDIRDAMTCCPGDCISLQSEG
ncbi:ferredoxin [Salidesulfovibrio onnuriiensis]|uniref:ferredoxin n=1 Tax=Salidesulfovibrio onnuriiensis TaxID=2583823 RepID=UPI0011CA9ABA|nr:ferredoxin [Salidesulfovibrio onnuriiensis]